MRSLAIALCTILLSAGLAAADEVIVNGDFETGDFTGWTNTGSGSGFGWTINNGTFDPAGPGGPLAPIGGRFDAVSSQTGPGLNLLSSTFVVPFSVSSAILSWDDRIRNHALVFSDPNQEFRVLLRDAGGALLHTVFSTNPGDPLMQLGPNHRSFDLTTQLQALGGMSIRVAFEQQDNLLWFNATVDNISFNVVPEPAGAALFAIGGLAVLVWRRRRKTA